MLSALKLKFSWCFMLLEESAVVKFLSLFLFSLLAIFIPIKSMSIAVVVVVVLDLLLGLLAAHKQKLPITSSGLKTTLIKLFVYEMALVLGLIIQKYLLINSLPLTNLIATLIACTEVKSVSENLEVIAGQPFLKSLIDIVSNKARNPE